MADRRVARLALVAALALGSAGCEAWYNRVPSPDQLWYVIPWFDHMIQQRSVHPYETADVPRNTVPGTVPITGGEADFSTDFRAGNTAAADALVNPFAGGADGQASMGGAAVPVLPATLAARGDTLYQTFCALCHGTNGAGGGAVGPRVGAPSLITPRAVAYSDGYLYSIIRYGRGVMPRYGDKIYAPLDRWAVVNHLRQLQRGDASAAVASGVTP